MVEYEKDSNPQYDLIIGTETMRELDIVLDFKAKTIIIDEIILTMRNIKEKIVLNYNKLIWTSKLQTCLSLLSTNVEKRPEPWAGDTPSTPS